MSRSDKAAKGILTSAIQYGTQIGMQVFLTPLILTYAGKEVLGAYAIIMQTVGYLAMSDLGISLALTRFLSQAYGHEDKGKKFATVLTTSRSILLFTNILFAMLLASMAIWINNLFPFSMEVIEQTRYALAIMAIWALVRVPLLVFVEGLNASQNMSSVNLIMIIGNAFRLLMSLWLVSIHMGIAGLVIGNITGEAVSLVLCYVRFKQLNKGIKVKWGFPDRPLFYEMFRFGKHSLLLNLAWKLVSATDSIVVGFLYGAVATSIYYTTQMPTVLSYVLANKIVDNFGPAINELHAKGDIKSVTQLFLQLHRYAFLIAMPLFFGIFLLNKLVIIIWVGVSQYAGDLMTISLASFAFITVVGHVNLVFVIAVGKLYKISRYALYEGIANLSLSFLLGQKYGLQGVMLATLLTHIPMAFYLHYVGIKTFKLRITQYIRSVILPAIPPSMIAAGCTYLVKITIPNEGWLTFVCAAITLLAVNIGLVYFLSIDSIEKLWVRKKIFMLS